MMDDQAIKILRLTIMVIVPIGLFFLGVVLFKRREKAKLKIGVDFDALSIKGSTILDAHKAYESAVFALVSDAGLLSGKVENGTQNSKEGIEIQTRMNDSIPNLYNSAVKLVGLISGAANNANDIQQSADEVLSLVKDIFNKKVDKSDKIMSELTNLRELVEVAHKEIVKNIT